MPLITHRGATPQVHPDAYIAPNAVVCGDVHIGAETRVLFGAVVTAEDGRVTIGHRCVIMENALIRGRGTHPVEIGDNVLIGPHAHVNGATIGEECYLATGCSLFPGSRLAAGVEVRINGVVHANTALPADATRSPGSPLATQPRFYLRTSTRRSGRSSATSTSKARSTAQPTTPHSPTLWLSKPNGTAAIAATRSPTSA